MDQFQMYFDTVMEWLDKIAEFLSGLNGVLGGASDAVGFIGSIFTDILGIITTVAAILTAIIAIGGSITVIVGAVIAFAIWLGCYVFTSVPYYKLGKKTGVKCAWLAWVPIPGVDYYCRMYVLSQIGGERPMPLFGKRTITPNRFLLFWTCMGIRFIGPTLVTAFLVITFFVAGYIPVVGQVAVFLEAFLYMIPTILVVFLEFVFLYDALCTFKKSKGANVAVAIIATLIDNVISFNLPTSGIATTIYLYTLLKRKPIDEDAPIEAELLFIKDTTPALEAAPPEALPEATPDATPEATPEALPETVAETVTK